VFFRRDESLSAPAARDLERRRDKIVRSCLSEIDGVEQSRT